MQLYNVKDAYRKLELLCYLQSIIQNSKILSAQIALQYSKCHVCLASFYYISKHPNVIVFLKDTFALFQEKTCTANTF